MTDVDLRDPGLSEAGYPAERVSLVDLLDRVLAGGVVVTGEITLSGLVFPVGGIKEKVMAAHRAGIRRIVLPDRNEADTEEIPEDVRKELTIIPATRVSDVLNAALEAEPSEPVGKNYMIQGGDTNRETGERLIAKEKR